MAEVDIEADHAVCFTDDILFNKVNKLWLFEKKSNPHHSLDFKLKVIFSSLIFS